MAVCGKRARTTQPEPAADTQHVQQARDSERSTSVDGLDPHPAMHTIVVRPVLVDVATERWPPDGNVTTDWRPAAGLMRRSAKTLHAVLDPCAYNVNSQRVDARMSARKYVLGCVHLPCARFKVVGVHLGCSARCVHRRVLPG